MLRSLVQGGTAVYGLESSVEAAHRSQHTIVQIFNGTLSATGLPRLCVGTTARLRFTPDQWEISASLTYELSDYGSLQYCIKEHVFVSVWAAKP